MEEMPRKLPLHVVRERTRHGKVVFFFRIGKGPRTRLPSIETPEFDVAYIALLTGAPVRKVNSDVSPKSIRWLIERYMESGHWAGLSVATRKQQGLFFKKAIENSGNSNYRDITPKDMRAAMEERKATPALANNFLKAMRGLFRWAVINDHLDSDPSAGVERRKNRSDGFPAWTMDDAKRFCEFWQVGTSARLAFELLLHSGLRRSDVCRAGRQHMNGNVFTIRTQKTGTTVTVEFSKGLLETIQKTKTGDLHFIVNQHNRPYSVESFGNWFRDCCRSAGIEKSAHGVRKLSATIAANAGATTHELMAQYGWATTQQAEVYTKGADRVRLGMKASRLVAEQIEANQIPHLNPSAGKIAKKRTKTRVKVGTGGPGGTRTPNQAVMSRRL